MSKLIIKIFLHIFSWAAFILLPVVFLFQPGVFPKAPFVFILAKGIEFLLLIVFFYFNSLLFLPKLWKKQKHVSYIVIIVLSACLILCVSNTFRLGGAMPPLPLPAFKNIAMRIGNLSLLITFSLVWAVSSCLWLLDEWQKTEKRLEVSERELLRAEIAQLKSRLHPHFLFNTLNGIYTLTLLKQDAASDAVLKLSKLMSYVLLEANHDYVSLKKDLDHLINFVELNKMRVTSRSPVSLEVQGEMDGISIAPLILLTFVENTFKYGVSNTEYSPIDISIRLEGLILTLMCRNKIFLRHDASLNQTGIGLANTKKRLDLMYPSKYKLQISEENGEYWVQLSILLSANGSKNSQYTAPLINTDTIYSTI